METVNFDFSALSGYYNAKINYRLASAQGYTPVSPTAGTQSGDAVAQSDLPWRQEIEPSDLLRKALGAASFLSDTDAKDALKQRGDVPKIFAAYEALAQAKAIADAAKDGTLPAGQESRAEKRMLAAISEVKSFLGSFDMEKSILIAGERLSTAQSEVAIQRSSYEYNTKVLHDGEFDAEVAAFTGDKVFTVTAKRTNSTDTVTIDLSEMEATTGETVRNLDNVADFINLKLEEAGLRTRFERMKIGKEDENGIIEGTQFGYKIKGTSTEQLSFSAADAQPAAVMVGQSGSSGDSGGQLSVWSDLGSADPTRSMSTRLGEEDKDTTITATAQHPEGGYIIVGTTNGQIGDGATRGENDAFMARYDSQGKMVWSRSLGAASEAEGLALAISDTGQIAITGKTSDDLTSSAVGGGVDTFVTLYDEDGIEQWTRQRGSAFDDQGNAIAFASDGSIVVGGTTAASMTNDSLVGGKDAFIEKIDTDGNQVWIRQFGTTGDDSVQGIKIASDGSVIVAGLEDGEAVMRRYSSDVDDVGDWTHSLGDLGAGRIGALEIGDDGSVYIGGATRMDGQDANGLTGTEQTHRDGFVAKFDVSGGTPSMSWLSRLGGEGYQSVEGITLSGSQVIVAGTGEAVFGSGSSDKDQSAYLASLDITDGTEGWVNNISGRGGVASASDIMISDSFSNTLDVFGLPDGDMVMSDSASVTDRLALRAGDHFFISVNGGRDKKITIEQDDNLRSLTFKINAALVLDGNADIRRKDGGQALKITPGEGVQIELSHGAEGRDALAALGLPTGVIMEKPIPGSDRANESPEIVTMGLIDGLNFDTKESRDQAVEVLDSALRGLRTAYRWAVDDPTLLKLKNGDEGPGKRGGQVPAYLSAQIANLNAGLQRLSAGGGGVNFFA
ncbi:MAG: hypothetical protein CMK09_16360 [Ponticaulis sp.]|nr:hypothetical protein [Ponticaulis sp.]|tara:strand:+ start:40975 stop:43671 length:2697 start_codon:yes stop_codon:yes gene_type:complete